MIEKVKKVKVVPQEIPASAGMTAGGAGKPKKKVEPKKVDPKKVEPKKVEKVDVVPQEIPAFPPQQPTSCLSGAPVAGMTAGGTGKVKMTEPNPDPVVNGEDVEMITVRQIGYLPPGSAIRVRAGQVAEYEASGKAKRRIG